MEIALGRDRRSLIRSFYLVSITLYIFLQNLYSDLERVLFWGEGFSLLLFLSCWKISYSHAIQKKLVCGIYVWIFLIFAYAIGSTWFLWRDEFIPLYLFRHCAYFYYATFFFGGYQWGPEIIQKLSRYWPLLLLLVLGMLFGFGGGAGATMLLGFIWLVCQKGYIEKWIFYLIPLLIIYCYNSTGNGTAKFISLLLFCSPFIVYFMRLWVMIPLSKFSAFFFRFFLLLGTVFLVTGANKLMNMIYQVAAAGGTFHIFLDEFAFTDMNGVWRILLWAHLLGRFLENPFGIGLGTPLADSTLGNFMYLVEKPGDEYTSGAHNFFLTFLVRLGIPFLIFFIYMSFFSGKLIMNFLKQVNFKTLDTSEKRFVFSSILAFLIGVVQASFNVVLESPIAAGIFWFNFGLFVRVVGDFLAADRLAYEK